MSEDKREALEKAHRGDLGEVEAPVWVKLDEVPSPIGFAGPDKMPPGDTLTIGAKTYEFVAPGTKAGEGRIAVEIGDSARATAENFAALVGGTVEVA